MNNIQSTAVYAYPNTRVMAWKGDLLKEEDFRGLASAKHMEEYVGLLEHTAYKKVMGRLTKLDVYSVQQMLLLCMIETHSTIISITPGNTKEFFRSLAILYEKELIKLILNNMENEKGRVEIDYAIYDSILDSPLKKFIKSVGDARTQADVVSLLASTKYAFLSRLPSNELKNPGFVSSYLDKFYFERVWESTANLSSKDSDYARRLMGKEIDMTNIFLILRSKIKGFDSGRFLIDVDNDFRNRLNQMPSMSVQEIVSMLSGTSYGKTVAEGVADYEKTKSLLAMEQDFRRHMYGEFIKIFKGGHSHIGILLGFLKLKEYELRNLRSIAISIENELSSKEIMELVVI